MGDTLNGLKVLGVIGARSVAQPITAISRPLKTGQASAREMPSEGWKRMLSTRTSAESVGTAAAYFSLGRWGDNMWNGTKATGSAISTIADTLTPDRAVDYVVNGTSSILGDVSPDTLEAIASEGASSPIRAGLTLLGSYILAQGAVEGVRYMGRRGSTGP